MTIQTTFAHGIRPSWARDPAAPVPTPANWNKDEEVFVPLTSNTRQSQAIVEALRKGDLGAVALAQATGISRARISGLMVRFHRDGVLNSRHIGSRETRTTIYHLLDADKLKPDKTQLALAWLAHNPGSSYTAMAKNMGTSLHVAITAIKVAKREGFIEEQESHQSGRHTIFKFSIKEPK